MKTFKPLFVVMLLLPMIGFSHQKKKETFVKNVWCILDTNYLENHPLLFPHNDFQVGHKEAGISLAKMEEEIAAIQFNMWNIVLYHFLKGELTLYSPFDPDWFDNKDEGRLMYPITSEKYGSKPDGTFETDSLYAEFVKRMEYITMTDWNSPLVAIKSQVDYYMDSIDMAGNVVYYPRATYWYFDKDIVSYKIREEHLMNNEGNTLGKSVKAIAPMVNEFDRNGKVKGQHELFWINFDELSPILKDYYLQLNSLNDEKIISYYKYFSKGHYVGKVIREDDVHPKKMD